jgi:hypothetical protein
LYWCSILLIYYLVYILGVAIFKIDVLIYSSGHVSTTNALYTAYQNSYGPAGTLYANYGLLLVQWLNSYSFHILHFGYCVILQHEILPSVFVKVILLTWQWFHYVFNLACILYSDFMNPLIEFCSFSNEMRCSNVCKFWHCDFMQIDVDMYCIYVISWSHIFSCIVYIWILIHHVLCTPLLFLAGLYYVTVMICYLYA